MDYVIAALVFLLALEALQVRKLAGTVSVLQTNLFHIERKLDQLQEGVDCIPKQHSSD